MIPGAPVPRVLGVGAEWITTNVGGANRYTEGLARAFHAIGAEQRWLVVGGDVGGEAATFGVHSVADPSDQLLTRWRQLADAWPQAAAEAAVVASHFALYAFPLRKHLRRLPHVVHFHGPWADESRAEGGNPLAVWGKRKLEQRVYATAERCITLSRAFAEILTGGYAVDPAKIRVIPGGVDCRRFTLGMPADEAREHLGWPRDRRIVLCVRRLVHRVGLEQLLQAMVAVRSAAPDVLLVIAGKGPLADELRDLVSQLGLSDSVRLLGFVPDDQLPMAYRAADLSVVPSQSLEGFGLIIVESLASGTPALVTPVGGMPEVVGDLNSELLFADTSAEAIAEGLSRALASPDSLPDADACRAYAETRFDWPVIAARVLEVYQEAIDSFG